MIVFPDFAMKAGPHAIVNGLRRVAPHLRVNVSGLRAIARYKCVSASNVRMGVSSVRVGVRGVRVSVIPFLKRLTVSLVCRNPHRTERSDKDQSSSIAIGHVATLGYDDDLDLDNESICF